MKNLFALVLALLIFESFYAYAENCETKTVQLKLKSDSNHHCFDQNIEGQFALTKCYGGTGSLTNDKEQRILFKVNEQWISRHDQFSFSTGKSKTEIVSLGDGGSEFTVEVFENSKTESSKFICAGQINQ